MLALTRFVPHLPQPNILRRIALMEAHRRERAALRDLPRALRRDVGLTDGAVRQELSRTPWDVTERR